MIKDITADRILHHSPHEDRTFADWIQNKSSVLYVFPADIKIHWVLCFGVFYTGSDARKDLVSN